MSMRGCAILVLALVGLPTLAVGQNAPEPSTGDESNATRSIPAGALTGIVGLDTPSESESGEDLPHIPAMLGGQGPSLAFRSEMERSNYIKGGVNVGADYDDNAFLTSSGQVGNTTFSVFPNIAIEQSTSRVRWSLGYAAGLTVNQQLSSQNQAAHDLGFSSEFRLSPHVNLRLAEDFSLTTGMFGANMGPGFQPGPGEPNASLITPLANRMSSQTVVETNYHFTPKDVVGATGSFYDLHYSDVSTGAGTLQNTRMASGAAYWLHELFHRDWGGLSYAFQRITFDPSGETRVHSFVAMNTLSLSRTFTVTAFIGPQYSANQGVAATNPNFGASATFNDWSLAGGVEGNWQKERTSVAAGYSRTVNNGAGILGAVRLQNIYTTVRRELLPGCAATFSAAYGDNEAITLIGATNATSIKTTSVGASLERNIQRRLGFRIGYFHDFQDQSGSSEPLQNFNATRNRFSVTLSYQWAMPLGR
jgi:hypothetical protein